MKNHGFWSRLSRRWKAVILALFVCPGAGQWMNGQKSKGVLIFLAFTGTAGYAILRMAWIIGNAYYAATTLGEVPDIGSDLLGLVVWFLLTGIVWLISVLDAWFGAPADPPEPEVPGADPQLGQEQALSSAD